MLSKLLTIILSASFFLGACQSTEPARITIGLDIVKNEVLPLALIDASPTDYFEQTLLVEATVTAVCERMGCWMQVEDQGKSAMVRWEEGCGGAFTFPMEMVGKRVQIQGSFYPKTISPEDAEHIQGESSKDLVLPLEGYEFNASAVRYASGTK